MKKIRIILKRLIFKKLILNDIQNIIIEKYFLSDNSIKTRLRLGDDIKNYFKDYCIKVTVEDESTDEIVNKNGVKFKVTDIKDNINYSIELTL